MAVASFDGGRDGRWLGGGAKKDTTIKSRQGQMAAAGGNNMCRPFNSRDGRWCLKVAVMDNGVRLRRPWYSKAAASDKRQQRM